MLRERSFYVCLSAAIDNSPLPSLLMIVLVLVLVIVIVCRLISVYVLFFCSCRRVACGRFSDRLLTSGS